MKEFEANGQENIQQAELINRMVLKLEVEGTEQSTSLERASETSKKVSHIISYLIAKENVFIELNTAFNIYSHIINLHSH